MKRAALSGVSETSLWTLRNRAIEAKRPDSVLEDPLAIELYDEIDCDWGKFGKLSQSHPLRALAFDHAVWQYLATHRNATVVALGEGLQTSYWRLGRRNVRWLSVDLEPVLRLREQLLPHEDSVVGIAASALDRRWMDQVDPRNGVVITAEGLLMYFDREDALALIADCARRFPGGQLIFDSIPGWFSRKTLNGLKISDRYTVPPMPFGLSYAQAADLVRTIDGVGSVDDIMLPPGRGSWKSSILRQVASVPKVRDFRPVLTRLRFA
ncbi:class I SAM-dependent methyltransferase [Rhodococcoides kyotonense]|uniref:O-Methyltransferase involved in polyketide biosynthesis n=1 Tax=Rhodococcoides kyotonense TaxID=398843 RepID=A0A239J793_9NOCA|nr:class I SAM-dependent methyltransferase [Rhodococcus kyotonensis]SNT01761.1 O-Methyltransferase involved in polyketide biosynthesis [Rhodococcus kyotonensis]